MKRLLIGLFILGSLNSYSDSLENKSYQTVVGIFQKKVIPMLKQKGYSQKIKFQEIYEKDTPPYVDDFKVIIVSSEFFEHKGATQDNFALALCHEIGHILGGSPTWKHFGGMSVEGQADYWGASVCFPIYLEATKRHLHKTDTTPLNTKINSLCLSKHPDIIESKVCAKTIETGIELIEYLNIYLNEKSFNLMNILVGKKVLPPAESTLKLHASNDCRLKTYINAALGEKRPSCWYNPKRLPSP